MSVGVFVDSVVVFFLVLFVIVVWFDGQIQEFECKMIFDVVCESGVSDVGLFELIEGWFVECFFLEFVDVWEVCIVDLVVCFLVDEKVKLVEQIFGNVCKVVVVVGGIFGFVKILFDEKEVFERFEVVFF